MRTADDRRHEQQLDARAEPRRTAPARAVALSGAALALALAGCGSSNSGNADPATAVPASAPLYISVTVRPTGSLKDSVNAVANKLHISNLSGALVKLVDKSLASDNLTYEQNFKPWLGQRVAFFLTSFGGAGGTPGPLKGVAGTKGVNGAFVAAITDAGAAHDTIMRIASQHGHPASRSYRGVSYLVDTSGGNGAAAVVGQLVAIASNETILKQLIDAQQGAASLANDASYRGVLAHLSGGASLGTLYVAPSALLDALQRGHRLPAGTATVLRTVFSFLGGQAFAGGLAVTPNAISLQTASVGGRAGPPSGAASGADLVAAMPGDTWLGIGISDLGGKINRVLRAIINIGQLGGVNVGAQLNRAFAGSGFNLQRDLLSWIGSTGLFVRGTSLANLGGALVIHSKNAARSRAAVAKLERLVRRLGRRSGTVRPLSRPGVDAGFSFTPRTVPLTFDVADGQGKFVIALGDAALAEALHPSGALTGNADYKAAGAALGGGLRPSVFFDFGPVVTLLDNLGLNASNPTYQRARPTLQALSVLAAGGSHSGDVSSNRLTLALH